MRLLDMLDERTGGTMIWIATFLAIALAMVVTGLALLAFGPPLT